MIVTGGVEILSNRLRNTLNERRAPDEAILFCLRGRFSQTLIALPSRALVIKPGYMEGSTFGARAAAFPYTEITDVRIITGTPNGFIELAMPDLPTADVTQAGSLQKDRDPMQLPNCVSINTTLVAHYQPFVDELRSLASRAESELTFGDADDPLAELADLREAGALTQAEFEQAKKRILDRQ